MLSFRILVSSSILLCASSAFAQNQDPAAQGEPAAKNPTTQNQANPGSEKQKQPDGDETGWGQWKPDKESKSEASRNEITGQPPASAPAK